MIYYVAIKWGKDFKSYVNILSTYSSGVKL